MFDGGPARSALRGAAIDPLFSPKDAQTAAVAH